ncbi:UNVERIFIED_CONTAM: Thioredoxin domain-containing protein 5 [Siphonaria sp. JEL0065]|nr:Thioredoxin domain-containing protein 5 [Siphonaria sp. JEL0065]
MQRPYRLLILLCILFIIFGADAKVQKCKPRVNKVKDNSSGSNSDCVDETVLEASSFDLYVGKGTGVWLVFFGTSWCPYCQKLIPEWKKVTAKVAEDGPFGMGIARFDCTESEQKQFCHNHGVKKYPNVRLYSNGLFLEKYSGERMAEPILAYISKKAKEMNLDSSSNGAATPPSMDRALPPMPGSGAVKIKQPPAPQQNQPPIPAVNELPIPSANEPPIPQQKQPPIPSASEPRIPQKEEECDERIETGRNKEPPAPQSAPIEPAQQILKQPQQPHETIVQQSPNDKKSEEVSSKSNNVSTPAIISNINTKLSKVLSAVVIFFGCYKLYQPFFAVRKRSVPLTTPFILDATASSLVFVYCLRNGFHITAFGELALYAVTGIYLVLADWEFSTNHDASKLRVMSLVFTMAIMTAIYALPQILSDVSPFAAAVIIYLNRFLAEKRKPSALPVRRGKKVKGLILDFAGLVIGLRVVTTFVDLKGDAGVLCYYVVLGCIHILGDRLFTSGNESDNARAGKTVD